MNIKKLGLCVSLTKNVQNKGDCLKLPIMVWALVN